MTSAVTGLAVDWASLTAAQFVAWTRRAGVAIPFPLSTGTLPYGDVPGPDQVDRELAALGLDSSGALAAARSAFGEPRLVVYAVRAFPDGRETKYAAVAGRRGRAVLVLLDDQNAGIREVADNQLAAALAGALPRLPGYPTPGVEVPVEALRHLDALIAAGESARTVRAEMTRIGMPPALVAVQEYGQRAKVTTGLLGAVGHDGGSTPGRSTLWRELPDGALLQIEQRTRGGQPSVLFLPYSTDTMFRAAVEAVSTIGMSTVGDADANEDDDEMRSRL